MTIIVFLTPSQAKSIDSEAWLFQHFAFERTESRELFLTLHGRASDSDFPSLYQIQPRATFSVNKWTGVGVNYSYFGIKRQEERVGNEYLFTNQHRLEAELQFRSHITNTSRYVARNRFEYLLDSNLNNISERIRHRSQLLINTPLDRRILVVSQIELFYSVQSIRINQTRTAPFGLRATEGPWTLQAQPMLLHVKAPDAGWEPSIIANIELSYDFS